MDAYRVRRKSVARRSAIRYEPTNCHRLKLAQSYASTPAAVRSYLWLKPAQSHALAPDGSTVLAATTIPGYPPHCQPCQLTTTTPVNSKFYVENQLPTDPLQFHLKQTAHLKLNTTMLRCRQQNPVISSYLPNALSYLSCLHTPIRV